MRADDEQVSSVESVGDVASSLALTWLQVNCALAARGDGQLRNVPWKRLAAAVEQWRVEERFLRWSFIRKAPGLRLRFQGHDLAQRLEPELSSWFFDAEAHSDIQGFRFGIYEPERYRFGGPAGMTIAHDHFDADSSLILRYEEMLADGHQALPRDMLSLAVVNDLLARALEDRAEIWDVWQRLARTVGVGGPPTTDTKYLERVHEAAITSKLFTQGLAPLARDLLRGGTARNEAVAAALRAAAAAGCLSVGVRAWLASACIFHWNRLGLTAADLRPMVMSMFRLLDPHGDWQ